MRIAKILKRQTLNKEQINKVLDKMSMFINTSIDEVNERDEYIIVIDKNIQGIIYYIDKAGNVYQAEDIIINKINPKIIAKYIKTGGDNYSIPEFNI